MLHFGGGYSDLKKTSNDWTLSFKNLNSNIDKHILGFTERSFTSVGNDEGVLAKDLKYNFLKLIGTNSYIFKPYTPFAQEWYAELIKRLDRKAPQLKLYPVNERGNNEGYPIAWTYVLGDIFHPLCLKYHKNIIHDDSIKPINKNYR